MGGCKNGDLGGFSSHNWGDKGKEEGQKLENWVDFIYGSLRELSFQRKRKETIKNHAKNQFTIAIAHATLKPRDIYNL